MNVPMIMEQNNQRVLTTAQLAEAYGTDENTIRQNFKRNKERFIEGKHFYALSGEELKKFVSDNLSLSNSGRARKLHIWTENGALLHAKSLNTDKAWEVYEFLVDSYFRKAEPQPKAEIPQPSQEAFLLKHYYEAVADTAMKQASYAIAKAKEMHYLGTHPEINTLLEQMKK